MNAVYARTLEVLAAAGGNVSAAEAVPDDILEGQTLDDVLRGLRAASMIINPGEDLAMPPWRLVLLYAVLNAKYRVLLKVRGWRIVDRRLRLESNAPVATPWVRRALTSGDVAALAVATARRAQLLPWVRPHCLPTALSTHELLARGGIPSRVCVGSQAAPFTPHLWVTVDDVRVDPGTGEAVISEFLPLTDRT